MLLLCGCKSLNCCGVWVCEELSKSGMMGVPETTVAVPHQRSVDECTNADHSHSADRPHLQSQTPDVSITSSSPPTHALSCGRGARSSKFNRFVQIRLRSVDIVDVDTVDGHAEWHIYARSVMSACSTTNSTMESPDSPRWPRVGVGVLIVRDGKVLIGKRKGSHGAGQHALPGGKLEWRETWEDCGRREVFEETSIDLTGIPLTYAYTCEAVVDEDNHWITVFMRAEVGTAVEAENTEPDKCEGWQWVEWGQASVPEPRFLPLDIILKDSSYCPVNAPA